VRSFSYSIQLYSYASCSLGEAGVTFENEDRFPWASMLEIAFRHGLILINWNAKIRHGTHGYPGGKWTPRNMTPMQLKEFLDDADKFDIAPRFTHWPEGMFGLSYALQAYYFQYRVA
jgi:hypothetical protein